MKLLILRVLVASLTFAIGLTSSWLAKKPPQSKRACADKSILTLNVLRSGSSRFTPTRRAYGGGYAQLYELADGREVSEGSRWYQTSLQTKKELDNLLSRASKIVARIPKAKNRFGDEGQRIIALFPADENGRGRARIIWYGGGQSYLFIEAPSLETALEFEMANAYAY